MFSRLQHNLDKNPAPRISLRWFLIAVGVLGVLFSVSWPDAAFVAAAAMVAAGLDLVAFSYARRRAQPVKRGSAKICSSGRSTPYLRSFVLPGPHWALTSIWLHFIIGYGLLFPVWFYTLLMTFRFRDAVVLFISDDSGVSIWTMCSLINASMIAYELITLGLIVTTRPRPGRIELIAYAILLVLLTIWQIMLSWPWLTRI